MPNNTNGSKWIRPDKRLAIYMRDGFTCAYCGSSGVRDRVPLTLDHLQPRELGGTNEATNLVCACRDCNTNRRSVGLDDWLARLPDSSAIAQRINTRTSTDLTPYRAKAKALIQGNHFVVTDIRRRADMSWRSEHLYA